MAGRTNGAGGPTEAIVSPSSSITLVTPSVRDDVGVIAGMLADVAKVVDNIDPKSAEGAPEKKDLLGQISKLSEDVNKIKLEQAAQVKAIRTDVRKNTRAQVFQSVEGQIQPLISDAIAARVQQEVAEWAGRVKAKKFAGELKNTVSQNDALLGEARIGLENLRARHANSTLDIHEDLTTELKAIKRQNGQVSEHFPRNLGELLSYKTDQLLKLIEEYELRPLKKHTENLNRVLVFIGVNGSFPDQPINFPDDQPPTYSNATETKDERNQRGTRCDAPPDAERNTRSSWW